MHRDPSVTGWRRCLPRIAYSHPNFAIFTAGFLGLHLTAFADGVLGGPARHSAPVFRVFDRLGGVEAWGYLHLLAAALLVAGVYLDFGIARAGFVFTLSLYTSTAIAFGYAAATTPAASWLGTGYNAVFALLALAGFMEPEENPAAALHGPPRSR